MEEREILAELVSAVRQQLNGETRGKTPSKRVGVALRLAEALLRKQGIAIPKTRTQELDERIAEVERELGIR